MRSRAPPPWSWAVEFVVVVLLASVAAVVLVTVFGPNPPPIVEEVLNQ